MKLCRGLSTLDGKNDAGDVGRFIAGQEEDGAGDILCGPRRCKGTIDVRCSVAPGRSARPLSIIGVLIVPGATTLTLTFWAEYFRPAFVCSAPLISVSTSWAPTEWNRRAVSSPIPEPCDDGGSALRHVSHFRFIPCSVVVNMQAPGSSTHAHGQEWPGPGRAVLIRLRPYALLPVAKLASGIMYVLACTSTVAHVHINVYMKTVLMLENLG